MSESVGTAFYSSRQVVLATFLGSPVAGAILMAANFRRLGQAQAAMTCTILGAIVSLGLLVLVLGAPDDFPSKFVPIVSMAGMAVAYRFAQEARVKVQLEAGDTTAPWGGAVGAGLASLVVLVGLGVLLQIVLGW